jgi:hypothetical protein
MITKNFAGRVLGERKGKLADPKMDVQPGRGARSIQRNLIKAISRGYQAEKLAKGK